MMFLLHSLALASTLFTSQSHAFPHKWSATGKAVYVLKNEQSGNNVIALPVNQDGTLGAGVLTPAFGNGTTHLDPMTLQPALPDPLLSQGAVITAGNYLFAVNALSNTLSSFSIDPKNPTSLTHLTTLPLPGTFPSTVAASLKHNLVCVGLAGGQAGISCARLNPRKTSTFLSPFDALRPLNLNQTTPPSGPPNSLSQISFTQDEKFLIAATKANPNVTAGFLSVYTVSNRGLSNQEVRSSPPGTALLFGFDQLPNTNTFVVSDPAYGAAVLNFDPKTCLFDTAKIINVAGQKAICWTALSGAGNTVFLTDGGRDVVDEVSVDGKIVRSLSLGAMGVPGLLDAKVEGGFLYALSPGTPEAGPSVVVVDVGKGVLVQTFGLKSLGATQSVQGLAVYGGC